MEEVKFKAILGQTTIKGEGDSKLVLIIASDDLENVIKIPREKTLCVKIVEEEEKVFGGSGK